MPRKRPKHINKVTTKGVTYWYHRRTGEQLPDDEAERNRRAYEINEELAERERNGGGETFEALRQLYLRQPKFARLADSTKGDYRRKLDLICELIGNEDVKDLTTPDVYAIAEQFSDTPRKADLIIAVLRIIMKLAVRQGWAPFNPVTGYEGMAESVSFSAWPAPVLRAVVAVAPPETERAILGLLETGLRITDLTLLRAPTEDDIAAGAINLVAQKTARRAGTEAYATLTPDMQVLIDEINAGDAPPLPGTPLFRNARGKPWTRFTLARAIRSAVEAAGHEGYSAHGLRHTRGMILAEEGASVRELMSALAHKSPAMALHYSEKASRKRLAKNAAERVSGSDRVERVVNLRSLKTAKLLQNCKTAKRGKAKN